MQLNVERGPVVNQQTLNLLLLYPAAHTAGRALLASLAAAPLLVRPALAEEGDAVDSAVDSLTNAIKVRRGQHVLHEHHTPFSSSTQQLRQQSASPCSLSVHVTACSSGQAGSQRVDSAQDGRCRNAGTNCCGSATTAAAAAHCR